LINDYTYSIEHDITNKVCQHHRPIKARSLCSLQAENDQDCFLIGTQSLVPSNNQVHLVKLQEETNALCSQVCID